MVILLVILLFAVFVAIDLIQERRRRQELARVGLALHEQIHDGPPRFVAGFELPEQLRFHQAHTWVHWVSPDQAYVGIDDFARRLLGPAEQVKLPSIGSWTDQGKPCAELKTHGDATSVLAPVSGEVIEVNPALRSDPAAMHRDCYGHGWMYKIRSPRLVEQLGTLLNASLASKWMEDTRERFQHQLVLATGNVIQDGGTVVDDVGSKLDKDQWRVLKDMFLTSGPAKP